jgi:hypothetical protein
MDERESVYPLEKMSLDEEEGQTENNADSGKKEGKYRVKPLRQLKSNFLTKQAERQKALEAANEQKKSNEINAEENRDAQDEEVDELQGLRIHFWVLVLPGMRDIADPFFIETTTAKVYEIEDSNFHGVEAVFSSQNYWVNMQTCYDGLKGISFDLGDNSKWEFVLLENSQPGRALRKDELDSKTGAGKAEDDEEDDSKKQVLDLPPSWVERFEISREKFELRTPSGSKTLTYKNANVVCVSHNPIKSHSI